MERITDVQPEIELCDLTLPELSVLNLIKNRRSKLEAVMTCAGPKEVQAPLNTNLVYVPENFDQLNPLVQIQVKTKILSIWNKRFANRSRTRNVEVVLHNIPYPLGTPYKCKIIFLLKKDSVEFRHPFRGNLDVELPRLD